MYYYCQLYNIYWANLSFNLGDAFVRIFAVLSVILVNHVQINVL